MGMEIVFLTVMLIVVASQPLPDELSAFMETQEQLVKDLAEFARNRHVGRSSQIDTCDCVKHACSNDWLDAPCDENLLTPEFCEEEGHRQDNRASIVRTPNGTYPHLTPSMKESICVYAHLEDFMITHDLTDDPGWSYIGLQDGVFTDSQQFHGCVELKEEMSC